MSSYLDKVNCSGSMRECEVYTSTVVKSAVQVSALQDSAVQCSAVSAVECWDKSAALCPLGSIAHFTMNSFVAAQ